MAAFGFTPASEQDVFSIVPEQTSFKTDSNLSGEEARRFYEDLMKDGREHDESGSAIGKKNHGRKYPLREKSRESSRRLRRRVSAVGEQQPQTESVVQRGVSGESDGIQRSRSERSTELQGLRLLRCAHVGDISGLKELLSKGVDINFQVRYLKALILLALGNELFVVHGHVFCSRTHFSGQP